MFFKLFCCLGLLLLETSCFSQEKVITGWIHQNDYDKALGSLYQYNDLLEEVAPAWYVINENAEIEKRWPESGSPWLKAITFFKKVRLIPLVMNVTPSGSNPDRVRALFRDRELRARHIRQIEELVVREEYSGIDLDYEGFTASEMTELAGLVEELAEVLHSRNRSLSVSLETQANDNALQGWQRIGRAADNVRIMTYGLRVANPGPVVPLDWMEARLDKVISVVPPEKLVHGIAVYGLAWSGSSMRSGTWEGLLRPAINAGITIERDPITDTPWYSNGGEVVWCEDSLSIKKKMGVSWSKGVRKFAFWRLGGEDPQIWPMIKTFLEEKRQEKIQNKILEEIKEKFLE